MWILIAIVITNVTGSPRPVSIVAEFHSETACTAELNRMQSASKVRVDYISCTKK